MTTIQQGHREEEERQHGDGQPGDRHQRTGEAGRGQDRKPRVCIRNMAVHGGGVFACFFGCVCGRWTFPGQGSNPCYSSDNTESLKARPPGNFRP